MNDLQDQIEMMTISVSWPHYPYLPVKRYRDNMPECGIMIAGSGAVVFDLNIWDDPGPNQIAKATNVRYASLKALVNDGWRVD